MPLRLKNKKKLILEKYYFAFSVTSNRDFGKFWQIISIHYLLNYNTAN